MCSFYESSSIVQLVTGRKGLITQLNSDYASPSSVASLSTDIGETMYSSSAFLTMQAMVLLTSSKYRLPRSCVKCGREARHERYLGSSSLGCAAFGAFWRMKKVSFPYCDLHSQIGYPGAVVVGSFLGTYRVALTCAAQSREFIEEFFASNRNGEMVPPWIAFKGAIPLFGWGQGDKQSWWLFNWVPFWKGMTRAEQEIYANHWQMPPDWREELLSDNNDCE